MQDDDDDFYMVLPSNGCKDTHPDNTANKFITSWEQPIYFEGNWKVALTEANLSYTTTTINRDFAIRCFAPHTAQQYFKGRLVGNVAKREVRLIIPELPKLLVPDVMITTPQVKYVSADVDDLVFQSRFPIGIAFRKYRHSSLTSGDPPFNIVLGIIHLCNIIDGKNICHARPNAAYDKEKIKTFVFDEEVILQFTVPSIKLSNEIHADEDWFWSNIEQMSEGLMKVFNDAFSDVKVYSGKLVMHIHPNIVAVEFINGLNIALGLRDCFYTIGKDATLKAERQPFLRHGINSMYIYSSVCRPIRVGETCVPLLKSLWLGGSDVNSRTFGEVRNIVVKNPMYIPLSSTSINSIEVNIRADSGRLIPFVEGSVTSLTLHFKRIHHR